MFGKNDESELHKCINPNTAWQISAPALSQFSTAELIAELEKRRPDCKKCEWPTCDLCLDCFWKDFGGKDIFKEAK